MIVVQAMAGEGSRFRAVDPDLVKPLVALRGKPLFLWALESLPVEEAALDGADGVLQLFRAPGDHWSFAEVQEGRVVRVAEKERIAEWCSTGLYGVGSASRFVELAWEAHDETPPGREPYVAPLYEALLRQGGLVMPSYASEVVPLGTPEELSTVEPGREADARRFLTRSRAA